MARGKPDGGFSNYQFAGQSVDTSLIYQFLWGFSPVDGLGRLIYLDTFNNGLSGVQLTGTPQPSIDTSNPVYSPPNSALLAPGTTVNNRVGMNRRMFAGVSQRIGIEGAFYFTEYTPIYSMYLDYDLAEPAEGGHITGYAGLIRFDRATTKTWQIYIAGGTWQTFFSPTNGTPVAGAEMWIQIKLVCDFYTGKYVRALVGDSIYDLSAYTMYSPGFISPVYPGYLWSEIRADSFGASTVDGHCGYYLVTKDEP